jgi:hypothetical protein
MAPPARTMPTPAAPPPRHRHLRILLPALATTLFAAAAAYILIRFLTVHDRLGHWQVTLTDERGIELGTGDLHLTAATWSTSWTTIPPFVTFDPDLAPPTGTVTWNREGARRAHALGMTGDGLDWTTGSYLPFEDVLNLGLDHHVDHLDYSCVGSASVPMATRIGTGSLTTDVFNPRYLSFRVVLTR